MHGTSHGCGGVDLRRQHAWLPATTWPHTGAGEHPGGSRGGVGQWCGAVVGAAWAATSGGGVGQPTGLSGDRVTSCCGHVCEGCSGVDPLHGCGVGTGLV